MMRTNLLVIQMIFDIANSSCKDEMTPTNTTEAVAGIFPEFYSYYLLLCIVICPITIALNLFALKIFHNSVWDKQQSTLAINLRHLSAVETFMHSCLLIVTLVEQFDVDERLLKNWGLVGLVDISFRTLAWLIISAQLSRNWLCLLYTSPSPRD